MDILLFGDPNNLSGFKYLELYKSLWGQPRSALYNYVGRGTSNHNIKNMKLAYAFDRI